MSRSTLEVRPIASPSAAAPPGEDSAGSPGGAPDAPAPSLRRRALLGAALAVALALADLWRTAAQRHGSGLFNDFYDYWAAGRILNAGGDPYDVRTVNDVLHAAGVHAMVGNQGYSYPLLLAELMRPLALLPPGTAAAGFTAAGLAVLGLATGLLLYHAAPGRLWEVGLLAVGAGLFAPVDGSLYFGQVNVLLLGLLAVAYVGAARPGLLAVVGAIKLYPAALLAAFAVHGRRGLRPFLAGAASLLALVLGPNLLLGHGLHYRSTVDAMLRPDPFWTNQSVNGFVSRLALRSSITAPPLPGLPVTPLMLLLCGVLGLAAAGLLALMARRRPRPDSWQAALALLTCVAVVAAPKNSLWNYTPLMLAAAYCWPRVRRRPLLLVALLAGWGLIEAQGQLGVVRDSLYPGRPPATWLASLALYGALLLGGVVGALVLRAEPRGAGRAAAREAVASADAPAVRFQEPAEP